MPNQKTQENSLGAVFSPYIPCSAFSPDKLSPETVARLSDIKTKNKYSIMNTNEQEQPDKAFEEAANLSNSAYKNFQVCSDLSIVDEYTKIREVKGCGFTAMYNLQKDIQENVYGHNFASLLTSFELLQDFLTWNYAAIQDEFRELYCALGGMSKYSLSFWKPWKGNHKAALADRFSALDFKDKSEAWFELIDILHFLFNFSHALGLQATDIIDTNQLTNVLPKIYMKWDAFELVYQAIGEQKNYAEMRESNAELKKYVDKLYLNWNKTVVGMFDITQIRHDGDNIALSKMSDNTREMLRSNIKIQVNIFLRVAQAMGMTPGDITNLYFAKNLENRRRQQKVGGY